MTRVTIYKSDVDWFNDEIEENVVSYDAYDDRSALQVVLDAINCGERPKKVVAADRWMSVSWVSGGKVKVTCKDVGYIEFDPMK